MYLTWKVLHLVGVFGFVGAHGASAGAALRIRRERDPARIQALLSLSRSTRPAAYGSLLLLVLSGIIAGVDGGWWGQAWIWWSVGLLIVLVGAAFPLAVPYYVRLRRAVDVALSGDAPAQQDLMWLLRSPRPIWILVVETVGILVILTLMVVKPG